MPTRATTCDPWPAIGRSTRPTRPSRSASATPCSPRCAADSQCASRGRFHLDPLELAEVTIDVVIDAASVHTSLAVRDEHVRGEEFFDTDHHREIRFHSHGTEVLAAGRYVTHGELTIRDITPTGPPRDPNSSARHPTSPATPGSASGQRHGCNAAAGASTGTPAGALEGASSSATMSTSISRRYCSRGPRRWAHRALWRHSGENMYVPSRSWAETMPTSRSPSSTRTWRT